MVRDKEIERLIHYAKGLNVKVTLYQKSKKGTAAEWTVDGTEIRVYTNKSTSKTDVILRMIHELAHHVWFIHERDRQPDLKFIEAVDRECLVEQEKSKTPAPKHLRKKIYDMEKDSTAWWESIYKEVDIKVPIWKLYAEMEYDTWVYEVYYETGFTPKYKIREEKYREIYDKHRANKEIYEQS